MVNEGGTEFPTPCHCRCFTPGVWFFFSNSDATVLAAAQPAAQRDYLLEIEFIQQKLLSIRRHRTELGRLKDLRLQLTGCLPSLQDSEEIQAVQLTIQQVITIH